tara:strand:- start:21 stop:344 length:324 start_codon:yes stop_codon:yes gene_type:complete
MLVLSLFLFLSSFAHGKSNSVRLLYALRTQENNQELFELIKGNKVISKEMFNDYNSTCKNSKVILSTNQYAPVAKRIEKIKSNENIINDEVDIYTKIASKKYILVLI